MKVHNDHRISKVKNKQKQNTTTTTTSSGACNSFFKSL